MIRSIKINNRKKLPFRYASDLPAFADGKEYIFKEGVNIIVGDNGCGKTTLIQMLKTYLCCKYEQCAVKYGPYDRAIDHLYAFFDNAKLENDEKIFLNGADVYADYKNNTFSIVNFDERDQDYNDSTFEKFGEAYEMNRLSKGQRTKFAINTLLMWMFSDKAKLYFDYAKEFTDEKYLEYIKNHTVDGGEWTLLMDEPDNSMDIDNVYEIYSMLSFHKEQMQVIAVLHNPLLIYKLAKLDSVNVIEMTNGYVNNVNNKIEEILNL